RKWARRVLGHGAVVIIVSDGWDRGDPAHLVAELIHLRRSSHRLIWLNPLLGSEGYEPLTRGMAAALPHCDDFLAAHNVAALEDLGALLSSLDSRKSR
ncbi:MAG TPA: VWA domain-containing protein, partial [Candidatus Dormibacteraeota bacterium]|nr:VWA domain-containing protein [Candidatus Dormibacteraeota bacterium]